MNKTIYKRFAKLAVRVGVNVKKGQDVWIYASTDAAEFALLVQEEAYKAGARSARIEWSNDKEVRNTYQYATKDTLAEVPNFKIAKLDYMCDKLPCRIFIEDDDPDVFNGIDMNKVTEARKISYPIIKPYYDKMDNKYQWTIIAIPSKAWACKVFPNDKPKDAVKKLWEGIIKTTRIDTPDFLKVWKKHLASLQDKANKMNNYNFDKLVYTSSNGTNLTIKLHPLHNWLAAQETNLMNHTFTANMPTEEVFTMPYKYGADGVVVSTKPLSYEGNLIEDFKVYFKKGKAVKVEAKKGLEHLERMIQMDEGASYLGEVALVPYSSPINQVGYLFYNTLFDENASCHLALGAAYKDTFKGYEDMSEEDFDKAEFNDSMNHVDFMVGSSDLHVVGYTHDGKEVVVFDKGEWAI